MMQSSDKCENEAGHGYHWNSDCKHKKRFEYSS